MRRFAFVLPRFGEGIIGGAETLCGELARRLAARGDVVEVFATCAVDNRTWENHFPEGRSVQFGLPTHRFPVDGRNLDVWVPLQIRISEGLVLSPDEQLEWMSEGVNSEALYKEISRRKEEFDYWIFAPYLFPTTFFGSLIAEKKAVLIPCLHNESYAYLPIIESMFRQVQGCLFNAAAEEQLARALYGRMAGGEVGMGFESADVPSGMYFEKPFPYLLYLGRKETGKNAQLLVQWFMDAKDSGRLGDAKLVVCGGGSFSDLHTPKAIGRADIIDVNGVTEDDKRRLLRDAVALCQPSTNESFSIVLMEAWLLGTPVLVHSKCAVTHEHVIRSGGGLYFQDFQDFVGVTETLLQQPELRSKLGSQGREYVRSYYAWPSVLHRFDNAIANIDSQTHEQLSREPSAA